MKTTVINLYGGPGAGKSLTAWDLGAELKKLGYDVELAHEYAKDLVWDENWEGLSDQGKVWREQSHRVNRLLGKVKLVITDSPTLFSLLYGAKNGSLTPQLEAEILADYRARHNLNYLVIRDEKRHKYQKAGRFQTKKQAYAIDRELRKLLKKHQVPFEEVPSGEALPTVLEDFKKQRITNN